MASAEKASVMKWMSIPTHLQTDGLRPDEYQEVPHLVESQPPAVGTDRGEAHKCEHQFLSKENNQAHYKVGESPSSSFSTLRQEPLLLFFSREKLYRSKAVNSSSIVNGFHFGQLRVADVPRLPPLDQILSFGPQSMTQSLSSGRVQTDVAEKLRNHLLWTATAVH